MPSSAGMRFLGGLRLLMPLMLSQCILQHSCSGPSTCYALGLTSAPIGSGRSTMGTIAAQTSGWSRCRPLFSSTTAAATSYSSSSASLAGESALAENKNTLPLRDGVWMPPSQNTAKRRGRVFSIQQPEDLLDFVIEDDRLSVVKVYASWCKTCKQFDIRWRKVASKYGDKYDDTKAGSTQIKQLGRARFAEMQYDNPKNEEICQLFDATSFPYILMYKGSKGKIRGFQCSPTKYQMLVDAVEELADPVDQENIHDLQQHLEELGLADRR